jgi:hypothetical protein
MNSRTNEISPVNFGYKKKSKSGSNINGIYRKDLSRFVKWPKYIRIQRQRRIFCQKLKIPPAIFQFSKTLDKNMSSQLFQLLSNYRRTESVSKHNMFKSKIKKFHKQRPCSNQTRYKHSCETGKKSKSTFRINS